ncbi:MAG: EamA family transporter [Pseudomonadales bacterium]
MRFKDSLLGLVIIVVWGVNFVVIAWGLEGMPPILMGALRFLCVALLGCWFIGRPQMPWQWVVTYALTIGFAQFAFLFTAMAVGMPAGLASLVLQSQALLTIIFSVFLLSETVRGHQLVAMVVAGAGLVVIGSSGSVESMTVLGFALTLVAAASWALGNVVTRKIAQRGYRADVRLVIHSSWISAAAFLMCSLLFEGPELVWHTLQNLNLTSAGSLLYLALIATILGYSLWSYLLSHYPAGQVAPLTLGVPVVGIASAAWLLDEQVSDTQLIGISLVMLGLMINMRLDKLILKLRRKGYAVEK